MRKRITKYNKSKFLNILTRGYTLFDKKNYLINNTIMDIIIGNFV